VADEEGKQAEAEKAPGGSSNKGLVVVVLIAAVVLGGGAAAAGAVVAMRMGAPPPAAPAESAEGKPHGIVELSPIVVDIRAADGTTHHLKVALSAETPGEAGAENAKEEMANIMPRGREAAIAYLRSLTYEEVTSPHSFEKIKEELSKRIVETLGEKHVVGVLVTDFVTQ
jgi:flagellar basal body-associated protein FliL